MPYDLDTRRTAPPPSLRAAVLDLMSRCDGGDALDERELRAALRTLVVATRRPADDLWERYHGDRSDRAGRVYARYGY